VVEVLDPEKYEDLDMPSLLPETHARKEKLANYRRKLTPEEQEEMTNRKCYLITRQARFSPLGIPGKFYISQRGYGMLEKAPIFSLALKLDQTESRLLPCNNDEEMERRVDWNRTKEHKLMLVTVGTRANLKSVDEYWSDND